MACRLAAVLLLTVALLPAPAGAGDFDWDAIVGTWEVSRDNDRANISEGVIIEVAPSGQADSNGNPTYRGTVVDARWSECLVEGMVVWDLIRRDRQRAATFAEYETSGGLDGACAEATPELGLDLAPSDLGPKLAASMSGASWAAYEPGRLPQTPDEIVGVYTSSQAPEITLEISGQPPRYRGEVIAAAQGSCHAVGDVVLPDLTYGLGVDGVGGNYRSDSAVWGVESCAPGSSVAVNVLGRDGEVTRIDVGRAQSFSERTASFFPTDEPVDQPPPSPPTEGDEPAADPRDFPDLGGTFELRSADNAAFETVRVRWTGNRDVPYEIVLLRDTDGDCPPVGTVIGRAIRNDGPGQMSGTLDSYEEGVTGCELTSTGEATYAISDDRGTLTLESASTQRPLRRADGGTHALSADAMAQLSAHLIFLGLLTDDPDGHAFAAPKPRGQAGGLGPLYVATQANFPDGLAVAGLAGRTRGATVLIDPERPTLNTSVLAMLAPSFSEVVVVGGEAVVPPSALPGSGQPGAPDRRLAGDNRFHTAQVLATEGWPAGTDTVYVATGANYPDALSGGAAASVEGAPVLLVDGGRMPSETAATLERLSPEQIIVLGGTAVVPESMVSQLQAYAPVTRLSGATRTETAVAVSAARFPDGASGALVASGDSFGPALLAASVAWAYRGPLLLVGDTRVPPETVDELQRLGSPPVTTVSINDEVDEAVLAALTETS